MTHAMSELYLQPTYYLDADTPLVRDLAVSLSEGAASDAEKATALFYRIRDGIRYDPYDVSMDPSNYRASSVIERGSGWCVPKSVALAGLARAVGIPSRLHFADIRNHQITEKLRENMKTDVFYYHGYAELYIDGRWLKATPAFNIEMCEKLGLRAVEFDGRSDGMLHTEALNGDKHIEYLNDRGVSADLPLDDIFAFFKDFYAFELTDLKKRAP